MTWKEFDRIRRRDGFMIVPLHLDDFKRVPLFLLLSPALEKKATEVKAALYEAMYAQKTYYLLKSF